MAEFNSELAAELVEMYQRDQSFGRTAPDLTDSEALENARQYLRQLYFNTERLKQIIATYGWPGYSLVESMGAQAAWLIALHADHDRALQQQAMQLLQQAVQQNEADVQHLAYLTDRVRLGNGQPQLYGTQFFGNFTKYPPIEDATDVDRRRQAIGLPPLADFRAQMEMLNGYRASLTSLLDLLQQAVEQETAVGQLPADFLVNFAKSLQEIRYWTE